MYRTMGMGVTLASAAGAPSGLDGPHPIASHALITRWWIPDDVQIKTLFGKSTPKSAHDYDPPPASP